MRGGCFGFVYFALRAADASGIACRRPHFLKRPKSKQKVFLLLCCPSGGCAIFEILLRGVARYAHPCAPRSKRRPWRFDPTPQDCKKQQKARVLLTSLLLVFTTVKHDYLYAQRLPG